MKHTIESLHPLAAILIAFGTLAAGADAALVVSNFQVTPNSISFSIDGEILGPQPADNFNNEFLFITTGLDNVDFLSPSSIDATASGILGDGSFLLLSDSYFFENGDVPAGDRISVRFNRAIAIGDTISGSIVLTGASNSINPQEFIDHGFAIHWGRLNLDDVTSPFSGTLQATGAVVPESSSALLLGLGGLGLLARRRR